MRGTFHGRLSVLIAGCASAAAGLADVRYDITALGLTSAEHVRADGYTSSGWHFHNDKGGVAGITSRWNGSTYVGGSAWFYENKVTTRIGFWDADHTDTDAYAYSRPIAMNRRHEVLGVSRQFAGKYAGNTAWLFSKGVTRAIGPLGNHVASDGTRSDSALKQNEAGEVAGSSHQYAGASGIGSASWIYSSGVTTIIGRQGPDAINASGGTSNYTEYLSASGHVTGYGGRYGPGGLYLGNTPWVYFDGQTRDTGLVDALHTSTTGERHGRSSGVNAFGHVIGYSDRYAGSLPNGRTAWVDRNGSMTTLGLSSGIHVAGDGRRVSEPTKINSAGQVAGWSTQYVGSAQGCSTWFYDGTTTRQIGLTDSFHTFANGAQYSTVLSLNDAGHIAGVARQKFDQDGAVSAFHYSNGVTRRIGLFDAKHQRADGWSGNTISLMNSVGQIAGIATRTNGYIGATSWFYDPALDQTFTLEFSQSSSGLAESVVQFLADDGVCLGTYLLFDGDANLGRHAFYWSMSKGFYDLGTIEAGTLGAQGWERLYDGIVINGNGDVIATGKLPKLTGGMLMSTGADAAIWGDMPVMLSAVPEPGSLAVAGLALIGLSLRRRR